MKSAEFFAPLEEGPILPLYYFYGNDAYLREKATRLVLHHWGEAINRGINFEVYSGASTPLSTIIDDARTVPFLGNQKVILIREAEKLAPSGQEVLLAYLKNPNPKTILILTGDTITLEKNHRAVFRKHGLVMEFKHPYSNEVPAWIKHMAQDLGKSISNHTTQLLQELVGSRLQDLSNELEKLSLYSGERKEITREDLETVISTLKVESVFELTDYIGNRKTAKALIALSQLTESGEPPLKILALITRQFRMITKARLLLEQGIPPEKIKHSLNIKDFIWKKLSPQVNKFSRKKLEKCFQRLWGTDVALKTQSIPKKIILEQLIIDLCE
jgi:DNA polymerase-3 subunit delta